MRFLVSVHMERINGTVERVPTTFATEAEAEAFIGPALLADCVLSIERTWRTDSSRHEGTKQAGEP